MKRKRGRPKGSKDKKPRGKMMYVKIADGSQQRVFVKPGDIKLLGKRTNGKGCSPQIQTTYRSTI